MTSLVLYGATVIDGDGREAEGPKSILIEEGRISSISDSEASPPEGGDAKVVDVSGRTVLPGLIDVHCHLTYGESRAQEEQDLYTSVESRTLRAAWNARKLLRAGVTSISQPGGSYYIGVAIRDAINAGMIAGPRMQTAGRYITTYNGIGDSYPTSVGEPEGSIAVLANTADEMKVAVRKQIKNGVDFIKLADSPFGGHQAFTYDELCTVTELAHQMHRRVTIHAMGSAEVTAAVKAEVDWIMHGLFMSDAAIETLTESGIPLVPTLTLVSNWADYGHLVGAPRGIIDSTKRNMERAGETLHRAKEAGVKFLTGTDTGFAMTPYGEWHARELMLLKDYAGLTPLECIRAATYDAADILNGKDWLGRVAPGYVADLLVVDGRPDKDLSVLLDQDRIQMVLVGGEPVNLDDPDFDRRWPHERSLIQSQTELLRRNVQSADIGDRVVAEDEAGYFGWMDTEGGATLEKVRAGAESVAGGNGTDR